MRRRILALVPCRPPAGPGRVSCSGENIMKTGNFHALPGISPTLTGCPVLWHLSFPPGKTESAMTDVFGEPGRGVQKRAGVSSDRVFPRCAATGGDQTTVERKGALRLNGACLSPPQEIPVFSCPRPARIGSREVGRCTGITPPMNAGDTGSVAPRHMNPQECVVQRP